MRGPVEIVFRHQGGGALEQARLAPAAIRLRTRGEKDPPETEADHQRRRADRDARRSESEPAAVDPFHPAPSSDASNMLCHRATLIPARARDCNCAAYAFLGDAPRACHLTPAPKSVTGL